MAHVDELVSERELVWSVNHVGRLHNSVRGGVEDVHQVPLGIDDKAEPPALSRYFKLHVLHTALRRGADCTRNQFVDYRLASVPIATLGGKRSSQEQKRLCPNRGQSLEAVGFRRF